MCGRFSLLTVSDVLKERFHVEIDEPLKPRYNIAPSQITPVILNSSPNKVSTVRWGFVPQWSKDNFGYINAKSETITSNIFKHAFFSHRCMVLADGFYEWSNKIPYRVTLPDESAFAFAGLYEEKTNTYCIITVPSNDLVKNIHHRMPAILLPQHERLWLDKPLISVLKPYPLTLKVYSVSKLVNSPKNDTPEVIQPSKQQTLL